jgi:UDP-N-acetylmuramate dehydrogenase
MSQLLRDYTTLRIGGPAESLIRATSEEELIEAVRSADESGRPLLIIGSGSNLLISDDGFDGVVLKVESSGNSYHLDACSGGMITIAAGENWDEFVAWIIDKGFAGIETMSGIPGTVGAAPIQNIGAYGHELSEFIARIRTWDRKLKTQKTFSQSECGFGYRTSIFKRERGRYVILDVTFQLRQGEMSEPITYLELANYLKVKVGDRAKVSDVRNAVMFLRSSKGMLLNEDDYDTWSAGSFFINPILSQEISDRLPEGAPRWPESEGRVKTSAAWLMEQAGMRKGFTHNGAGISSKHILALVNNGQAQASDILAIAKLARAAVKEKFGVLLEPEVEMIGLTL